MATFIASWWLIGDQTEASVRPDQLEYVMRAPDLPDAAVVAAGVVSFVVGVALVLSLIVARRRGKAREELPIVAALAAAGFVLAGIAGVETAGSNGANIGGGLGVVFGGPIVVMLFAYALLEFRKIRSLQRLSNLPN